MNVYIVTTVWDREGSTVIGAATDRAGAETIADQIGRSGPAKLASDWAPWVERVDPAEGSCTWERMALLPDGAVHPSLSQEIVCVPLAGGEWLPADKVTDPPDLDAYPDREIGAGVLYIGGPTTPPG